LGINDAGQVAIYGYTSTGDAGNALLKLPSLP
jgi:hypothetical protein